MSLRISSLVVAALGAGCLSAELDGVADEPNTSSTQQDLIQCPPFMCGTNSPQIAEFGFWDLQMPPSLSVAGHPNNVGLQVVKFVQAGHSYLPKVIGGRLYAFAGSVTLAGSALADGYFLLRNGRRTFKLRIKDVNHIESWALRTDGTVVVLEDYRLDWAEFLNGNWGDFRDMCNNTPSRESSELLTMTGNHMYRTLLFEGDRIDAVAKRDTGVDLTWFNLGCAGSALAKMALTGHTEGSHVAGEFHTSLAERQAMLKMFAADYCGDGTVFTVSGQPLNWRDDRGTMQLTALLMTPPQPLERESRWNETGAVCLDKARVDVSWTQLGATLIGPDVYGQVQHLCGWKVPPCSDNTFDTDGYHLLTATVPFPAPP